MTTIPPPVEGATAVAFDPAVARALAGALDDLAQDLDRLRSTESRAYERAAEEWRGRTAVWVAHRRPDLVARLQRSARACEDAGRAVRAAEGRAADAQASRNAAASVALLQAEARAALGQGRVS